MTPPTPPTVTPSVTKIINYWESGKVALLAPHFRLLFLFFFVVIDEHKMRAELFLKRGCSKTKPKSPPTAESQLMLMLMFKLKNCNSTKGEASRGSL